jgi:hypothetical protein
MRLSMLSLLTLAAMNSACTTTSLGSHGGNDQIVLTDASKRAITVVGVKFAEDGRRVKPDRVLCAEPSPDIARAVSSAIEASLGARAEKTGAGSAGIDAAFSRNVTESIAQLGSRLATIQLLRDELSDLCRAYANGAVSSITYTLRLSRLDKKMITLLVSEASAGALTRALVAIDGASGRSIAVLPEKLQAAESKVKEAAQHVANSGKQVKDAQDALVAAGNDDEKKKSAALNLKKSEDALNGSMTALSDRVTEKLLLESRGSGHVTATSTLLNVSGTGSTSLSAVDLRAIHRAYLEDDDAGTLLDACLTSMEDNATAIQGQNPEVAKLRTEVELKERDRAKLESEFEQARQRIRLSTATIGDRTLAEELEAKLRLVNLDLKQLDRKIGELSGVSDRTALLRFCRNGMEQITAMIERKIFVKAEAERLHKFTELCKAAFADPAASDTTKSSCLRSVLGPSFNPAGLRAPSEAVKRVVA